MQIRDEKQCHLDSIENLDKKKIHKFLNQSFSSNKTSEIQSTIDVRDIIKYIMIVKNRNVTCITLK